MDEAAADVLYERVMPHGPVVRIRRVTAMGEQPVRAVIEVDRRAGTPRGAGGVGSPPPLMAVEGDSDDAVRTSLMPFAEEDSAVARLLSQRGAR
ncbi:MAG: hypothetical protein FJ202_11530 [Gemmatimonadetes bacterium]|nr:hypothetical protein [Gemmatimonadota bacterium]